MEELMYYVWQQKLFQSLSLPDDRAIEILDPGLRNMDSGPDFFNAKIRMGEVVWAGNVEMHVRASDWLRHHHQTDAAYNSVILHVVLADDRVISLPDGSALLQVKMTIPDAVMQKYRNLTTAGVCCFTATTCAERLGEVPPLIFHDWLTSLAAERMMQKAQRVLDLTEQQQESWQEAFYVILTRSFGTGINGDACERLARSLPYAFLLKHLDNRLQIEALLLGQAGFLSQPQPEAGDYYLSLQQEYAFLQAKFSLRPLPVSMWKLARLRPAAFPPLRLAYLAALLCSRPSLLSAVLEAKDIEALMRLFRVRVEGFWLSHYAFTSAASPVVNRELGQATLRSLIINAVVPMMLAYARWQADEALAQRAMSMLESLPAESNRYMEGWIHMGIPVRHAFDTQALLQLYKCYCEPHKCLRCRLGCWLMRHPTL